MRRGEWPRIKAMELAGKTVGVVGLGRIGRRVSEMLQSLRARVIATDPAPDLDWCRSRDIPIHPLKDLLNQSDVVTLHLSIKAGQPPLLGPKELTWMKPNAYLVNLSRGGTVDEDALLHALSENRLAGAALDVYAKEPYQGPLAGLEQVILTAHVGSFTQESRALMEHEAVDNLLKQLENGHASPR